VLLDEPVSDGLRSLSSWGRAAGSAPALRLSRRCRHSIRARALSWWAHPRFDSAAIARDVPTMPVRPPMCRAALPAHAIRHAFGARVLYSMACAISAVRH